MFAERVKSSFAVNEPIYTEEIIRLFPDYSRPQIFRFIKEAEEKKEIVNFAKGIYYIPRNTFIGLSTITADTVILPDIISPTSFCFSRADIYATLGDGTGL